VAEFQPAMSLRSSIGGIRRIGSGLAAFVLFLSMFSNAFPKFTADCCRGKMCPIHDKHAMPVGPTEKSHMDCEHEEMGLQPCSMSCGRSDEQGQQTTVAALLPGGGTSAALIPVERSPQFNLAVSSDVVFRPSTPPPRFTS
jgi:hypothetical protein